MVLLESVEMVARFLFSLLSSMCECVVLCRPSARMAGLMGDKGGGDCRQLFSSSTCVDSDVDNVSSKQ